MDSDSLRDLYYKRNKIVESIRNIQIEPNKTFRQVEVSESTMLSATKFIKAAPNVCEIDGNHVCLRYSVLYSMDIGPGGRGSIYELLSRDAGDTFAIQADQKFQNWEDAVQHLLRYALNLLLAPRRPEFQSIKLYSSFYVYQVAKKLNGAEKILMAMGYKVPYNRSSRDADELKIEGEVDLDHVARIAADLVILKCDLKLLKGNVKAIGSEYPSARITDVLKARSIKEQTYENTYEEAVGRAASRLNLAHHISPNNMSNCGRKAPYSTVDVDRHDFQACATEQSNSNVLSVTPHVKNGLEMNTDRRRDAQAYAINSSGPLPPPYNVNGQDGNLLPRSVVGDKRSKQLTHHDSAPLLDDVSTREAISPYRSRIRKISGSEGNLLDRGGIDSSGNTSRAEVQSEAWERAERKWHASGINTRAHSYSVGSPNDLEESFVAQTDRSPPNPDDLPAPVFENEAAVMNNVYQHNSHYSYSGSPGSDSRVDIFVQKSEFSDVLEPLQPMSPNVHAYSEGRGLEDADPHRAQQSSPPKSPYNNRDRMADQSVNSDVKLHHHHDISTGTCTQNISSGSEFPAPTRPLPGYLKTHDKVSQLSRGHISGSQAASRVNEQHLPATEKNPRSTGRQDNNKPKKIIESSVDDFVNIDLVDSPSSRKRSSHISESSRTEYEEKQKNTLTVLPEDLEKSTSESDLDFGKNQQQASSAQWICDYCTFINSDTEECEVCGIPHKKPC